jgi:hypothetical protein
MNQGSYNRPGSISFEAPCCRLRRAIDRIPGFEKLSFAIDNSYVYRIGLPLQVFGLNHFRVSHARQ